MIRLIKIYRLWENYFVAKKCSLVEVEKNF